MSKQENDGERADEGNWGTEHWLLSTILWVAGFSMVGLLAAGMGTMYGPTAGAVTLVVGALGYVIGREW